MDDKLTIFMAVIAVAVVLQMVFLAALCFILRRLNERLESVTYVTYLVDVMWEMVRARLLPALEETTRLLKTSRPKIEVVLDNLVTLTSTIHDPALRSTVTADLNDYAGLAKAEIPSRQHSSEISCDRQTRNG
jgi:hypothetical protein